MESLVPFGKMLMIPSETTESETIDMGELLYVFLLSFLPTPYPSASAAFTNTVDATKQAVTCTSSVPNKNLDAK